MFVLFVLVIVASRVNSQDHVLSTATPSQPLPLPFIDLFTGASNIYSEPSRKSYSDSSYYVSCPKSDTLSSLANIIGSAAKILMSAAAIVFLKLLIGKMFMLPIVLTLFVKLGLKVFFLWPMISKMVKYFKKKKKKGHKSRMISDCSQRIACVIQRSSKSTWSSYIGATVTFFLIDDLEEDGTVAKSMLSILADDKIAQCMSLDCSSGIDIS